MNLPAAAEREPRYHVLEVVATQDGLPLLVKTTGHPFRCLVNAWSTAGALRRLKPEMMLVVGDLDGCLRLEEGETGWRSTPR